MNALKEEEQLKRTNAKNGIGARSTILARMGEVIRPQKKIGTKSTRLEILENDEQVPD